MRSSDCSFVVIIIVLRYITIDNNIISFENDAMECIRVLSMRPW